jgi:cytochrome P450
MTEGHPAFGFGRRVCPGRNLAVRSLYLVLANLVYNFDFKTPEVQKIDTWNYSSVSFLSSRSLCGPSR